MKAAIDGITYEGTPDEIAEIVGKLKRVPPPGYWTVPVPAPVPVYPSGPQRPAEFPDWTETGDDHRRSVEFPSWPVARDSLRCSSTE